MSLRTVTMNLRCSSLLPLLCLVILTPFLRAAPFAVSPGITTYYPLPDESISRDTLLAVDAGGYHHFVSLTGMPDETQNLLTYNREEDDSSYDLRSLPGSINQIFQAITTTASSDVLLMTYSIGGNSPGYVLYHLNGPTPSEPRLVIPTNGFRDAVTIPLEDGSVLVATRSATQIRIGRLLAGSYDYEEVGAFSPTGSQEFSAISAFVEPDQTIHLAATTYEEVEPATIQSYLLYRRFELDNLAANSPWQSVTGSSTGSSATEVAAQHAIAVTTETVIVYEDQIASELRGARMTATGWDIETLQTSSNIGRLFLAPDELGTLTAAWDNFDDATSRYRTFGSSGWMSSETLPVDNFSSFFTDRGGYLHGAGRNVVTLGSGERVPIYQSFRPRDITDRDCDGLPYVLEDVLGTDPSVPNFGSLTFGVAADFKASLAGQVVNDLAPVGASESSFYSAAQDIVLKVESSTDLSIWREAIGQVDSEILRVAGRRPVLVTTLQENTPGTPRRFMRLKATRNR